MRAIIKSGLFAFVSPVLRTTCASDTLLKLAYYPRFREWRKTQEAAPSVPASASREEYFRSIMPAIDPNSSLDYLEFGVHRGESINWWAEHHRHPESRFVGFDSFEGLPENWIASRAAGHFSTHGELPSISDHRVEFKKGWFHQTTPDFLLSFRRQTQMIVHLDADLYRSTLVALLCIGPALRAGDILMFDEFSDSIHEYRAFMEWAAIYSAKCTVISEHRGFARVAMRIGSI